LYFSVSVLNKKYSYYDRCIVVIFIVIMQNL
jgi:hypothetical protein